MKIHIDQQKGLKSLVHSIQSTYLIQSTSKDSLCKLVFLYFQSFNVKTINKSHYQHRIYNPKESEIRSVNELLALILQFKRNKNQESSFVKLDPYTHFKL